MAIISPTVHTAGISALELALNQALALDPMIHSRLADLHGQVFRLRCTSPELDVFMLPQANSMRLLGYWDGDVTTTVTGSASDFADLAAAQDPTAELINGNIELIGESASLIELQTILRGLDMDWEAPLVNALGDVAGHQLAQALRGLFSWGQQAQGSLSRQVEEFIVEEARLTPSRLEVDDFRNDLEALNMQVDRLQARIKKLATRIQQRAAD